MEDTQRIISWIESLDPKSVEISRRRFLRYGTITGLTVLLGPALAACAQQVTPTPTAAPKPTSAPTQAPAAVPTQAPAPAPTKAPEAKPEAKPAQAWSTSVLLFGGNMVVWADVMKERTLGTYNISLQADAAQDTRAMYTTLAARGKDFFGSGWLTIADMRNQGQAKAVNVGAESYQDSVVYVKVGSPIKSLADLKGKKIGMYGSAAGTSTHSIRVITKELYGYDILKESQASFAAPPIIHQQLVRGETDACYNIAVSSPQLLDKSQFTIISDISDEWMQKRKANILITAIATYDDIVQKNPDGVRNLLKARAEAVDYLKNNMDVTTAALKKVFDLKDDATAKALAEIFKNKVTYTWNKDVIKTHIEFGKLAANIVGKDVVSGVPDDAFTDQFAM